MKNAQILNMDKLKLRRTEKAIRKYMAQCNKPIIRDEGESRVQNLYLFKPAVDNIYKDFNKDDPDLDWYLMLWILGYINTYRSLKTDQYICLSDDFKEEIETSIAQYHLSVLHIYNHANHLKANQVWGEIMALPNCNRKTLIPFKFSNEFVSTYPIWFPKSSIQKIDSQDKLRELAEQALS